jgi:hypothetical protein
MFSSKQKAIALSLARFDKDTQTAFLSLYNKIDAEPVLPPNEIAPPSMEVKEPPF